MKGTRAAQRYAKAILSLARERNSAEAVNEDMKSISNTIAGSKELKDLLNNPVVKDVSKKKALLEIFRETDGITKGVFDLLIRNERINILDLVARQYMQKFNDLNRTQEAVVTTAVSLTPELEKKVRSKVRELTGAEASVRNIVDPDLIGGFILRVGDLQYDASVISNLNRLKREFKSNTYVSKI